MSRKRFTTFALLAAVGFCLAAAPPADPPPTLDTLLKQLADPNFATRENAQRQLESLPLTQRDTLAKIAENTTDAEAKSRLTQIVDHMDELLATDPPPLSLDLTNATYEQVNAALAKITTINIGPPPGPADDDRFNLKAANQPLWQLIRQLADQHPVSVNGDPLVISPRPASNQQIIRGVLVFTDDAKLGPNGKITLSITYALDPRINVVDLRPLSLNDARDDQGHLLHFDPAAETARLGRGAVRVKPVGLSSRLFTITSCTFTSDAPPGQTATFTGNVNFLVTVSQKTTEIANAAKHLNEPISLGDSKVTLREMLTSAPDAAGNKRHALSLAIVPDDANVEPTPPPNIEISPTGNGISLKGGFNGTAGASTVIDHEGSSGGIFLGASSTRSGETTKITVTDATGKTVASYSLPRGQPVTSVHVLSQPIQEPLTYKFSTPTKTLEVAIPFEFRNLPIQR